MLLLQEELDDFPEKMDRDIIEVAFEALNKRNFISEIGAEAMAKKITIDLFKKYPPGEGD